MEINQENLEAMFYYLDELRESGSTNMFGAAPHLEQEFELGHKDALKVLTMWMSTFDGHTNLQSRVSNALHPLPFPANSLKA